MQRRTFMVLPFVFINKKVLSCNLKKNVPIFNSIKNFRDDNSYKTGQVVWLLSFHIDKNLGGGFFKLSSRDENTVVDNGFVFSSNMENMIWKRIRYNKEIRPEWYGCVGDGVFDDGEYLTNCLNNLKPGSSLIFKDGATYYNSLSTTYDKWIIKCDSLNIYGKNVTLKRNSTAKHLSSNSYGNLATITFNANKVNVYANLTIDGGEEKFYLSDCKGNNISKDKYSRSSSSSHALYISDSSKINFHSKVICCNAVFPCYINNSKFIHLNGEFKNSGQVYPVIGDDLQLGSCIKLSQSSEVNISGVCFNSAYSGCEVEPRSSKIKLRLETYNCFSYGVIIHDLSHSISLILKSFNNINGGGLRISKGSYDIDANIDISSSPYAIIISSMGNDVCKNINITYKSRALTSGIVQSFNTTPGSPSYLNTKIKKSW